jgi:type I restriction enzyme S subunit
MIDSELGLIPEGWRVEKLGEIIEFSNGYAFKSEDLLGEEAPNCYKVFKMGNIKKGGGLNTNGKQDYIDKNKCRTLTKYVLHKGDLLMSMTDMKDNVSLLGNTALMNEDNRYIVNQRVGLIRSRNDIYIDFPYLYLLTNNDPFLTNLRKVANSGVQVNLSTQAIKDSLISIPKDKQILKNFDSLGKSLFEKIFNNEYNVKSLKEIKTALLNKLIPNK